jgi:hypothetical protein
MAFISHAYSPHRAKKQGKEMPKKMPGKKYTHPVAQPDSAIGNFLKKLALTQPGIWNEFHSFHLVQSFNESFPAIILARITSSVSGLY